MPFRRHRILWQALAVSLLAHAVLLVDWPWTLRELPGPAAALSVVVRQTGERPATRSAVAPLDDAVRARPKAPPTAVAPTPPEPPAPAVPVLAVPGTSESSRAPAPAPPSTASSAASSAASGSPPTPGTRPAVGAAEAASARGAAAASGAPVSGDALRDYSLALGLAARQVKRYPALARERGWEGSVEVVLDFRAGRGVPEVSLGRSSGRALLDDEALSMMRQAVRATPLPPALRERDFRLPKTVEFSLAAE